MIKKIICYDLTKFRILYSYKEDTEKKEALHDFKVFANRQKKNDFRKRKLALVFIYKNDNEYEQQIAAEYRGDGGDILILI